MLVARVCQFYPNAAPSTLVNRFFKVFSQWIWPNMNANVNGCPVILKAMPSYEELPPYGFTVWDPRYNPSDKFHLMPIITPAYPQQNSTFNVTYSTRSIMIDEIKRAHDICIDIFNNKCSWDFLFEPRNFFQKYKHFIVLIASTTAQEQYMDWVRLVESKIRHLVSGLEKNQHISLAHVNPQGFQQTKECKNTIEETSEDTTNGESSDSSSNNNSIKTENEMVTVFSTLWFVGIELKPNNETIDLNLTDTILNFKDIIYKQAKKVLINYPQFDAKYVKRARLRDYLPQSVLKLELKPKTRVGSENGINTNSSTVTSNGTSSQEMPMSNSVSNLNKLLHSEANQIEQGQTFQQQSESQKSSSSNQLSSSNLISQSSINGGNTSSKGYLSPCSDSNDSLFTFNNTNINTSNTSNNQCSTSSTTSSESSNQANSNDVFNKNETVQELVSESITNDSIITNQNLNKITNLNINSPSSSNNNSSLNTSNKRSLSPCLFDSNEAPIKKQKELNVTMSFFIFKNKFFFN